MAFEESREIADALKNLDEDAKDPAKQEAERLKDLHETEPDRAEQMLDTHRLAYGMYDEVCRFAAEVDEAFQIPAEERRRGAVYIGKVLNKYVGPDALLESTAEIMAVVHLSRVWGPAIYNKVISDLTELSDEKRSGNGDRETRQRENDTSPRSNGSG